MLLAVADVELDDETASPLPDRQMLPAEGATCIAIPEGLWSKAVGGKPFYKAHT